MTFLIISTIAGIMLALRFKVVVLVPAVLLATAVITMSGILSGHKAGAIALTVFGTAALLQIGYISGCILHALAQSSDYRRMPRGFGESRALTVASLILHVPRPFVRGRRRKEGFPAALDDQHEART